jgi:hypothetical protein
MVAGKDNHETIVTLHLHEHIKGQMEKVKRES